MAMLAIFSLKMAGVLYKKATHNHNNCDGIHQVGLRGYKRTVIHNLGDFDTMTKARAFIIRLFTARRHIVPDTGSTESMLDTIFQCS